MDDGTNPQGGPDISADPSQQVPAGVTFGNAPPQGNTPSTEGGPPQGVTFGAAPPDQSQSQPSSGVPDSLHIDPNAGKGMTGNGALDTLAGNTINAAKGMNAIGAGAGQGVLSTAIGIGHLEDKLSKYLPDSVSKFLLGSPEGRQKAVEFLQGKSDELANQNKENPILNAVGYGGETLAEFLTGDEAFKALSESDKLMNASKIMKVFEKSPRLTTALKVGAQALKAGARTGAVQGAQTLVRSGGDTGAALKDAAIGGVVGTGLGAVTGGAAAVLGKAGDVAEGVQGLTDAAGNAETKAEVAKSVGEKLDLAKNQLHTNYEAGINDLKGALEGQEVDPKINPLAVKAQQLLNEPLPEDHAIEKQAKDVAGDKLTTKVKALLTSIARGEEPITDENIADAKAASQPSGLVDANGRALTPEPVEPHGNPAQPYTIKNLVGIRQAIRSAADGFEYGDANSRTLRALINDTPNSAGGFEPNAMDQTIEQMAQRSGNPEAISNYKDLRADYRNKIGLFDDPVIQNLRDQKAADAARAFVGVTRAGDALPTAGKVPYNINNLRTLIGDQGLKEFGKQVFGTIMNDSIKSNRFNPAYFMDTMNKITPETKASLFDLDNAQNGLKELYSDAQSAAKLQHLTRVGVLTPLGIGVGAVTGGHVGAGIGTILGMTVAEGGGIKAGRQLLDYVANHPAVWGTYKIAGKAANSAPAAAAATAARGVAAQGGSKLRQVLQGTKGSLGGNNPNPNQAEPVYVTPSFKSAGLVQPGNLDLNARPDIKNPDGSHSSVFSMSFGTDNGEVLVPGVGDGKTYPFRQLSTKEALDQYRKTGNNLGTFKTAKDADRYGEILHEDQEKGIKK